MGIEQEIWGGVGNRGRQREIKGRVGNRGWGPGNRAAKPPNPDLIEKNREKREGRTRGRRGNSRRPSRSWVGRQRPLCRRASPPVCEATAPCGPTSSVAHLLADSPSSSVPPCSSGSSMPLLQVDSPTSMQILDWSAVLCGPLHFISVSLPSASLLALALLYSSSACLSTCA